MQKNKSRRSHCSGRKKRKQHDTSFLINEVLFLPCRTASWVRPKRSLKKVDFLVVSQEFQWLYWKKPATLKSPMNDRPQGTLLAIWKRQSFGIIGGRVRCKTPRQGGTTREDCLRRSRIPSSFLHAREIYDEQMGMGQNWVPQSL